MDRLSALYRQYEIFSPCVRSIADIGADHGYLALRILGSGFEGRLIVTDIAEQPLALAQRNIGDRDGVEFRQCSGLDGDFSGVDLFFVAGMGGDLIADIVRAAVQDGVGVRGDARFVLQPMTNFEKVFEAIGDKYLWSYFASEKSKSYRLVVAGRCAAAALGEAAPMGVVSMPTAYEQARRYLQNIEDMGFIDIPFVADFDADTDAVKASMNGARFEFERVLIENIPEAICFFESRMQQQEKITESARHSGDALLLEKCAVRGANIQSVLRTLREALG